MIILISSSIFLDLGSILIRIVTIDVIIAGFGVREIVAYFISYRMEIEERK